jgi:predicted metal-dependent phosphoesterase TrpH
MIAHPVRRPGLLRADLHVHSRHSGFTRTLPVFRSLDCYSPPEAVYRRARARGMDLVTITDHDSIDGCLELLDRHPDATDIVMGEEIECRMPDTPVRLHIGALGMTEQLHRDVQPLRGNVFEALAFLRQAGVALVLHHPFHFFRGEVPVATYMERLLPLVHAVETRNAMMDRQHNELTAAIADGWCASRSGARLGQTGGSDAHVLRDVGIAYTEAPGRTREDYLGSVRGGRSVSGGLHGTTAILAVEIYGVILNHWAGLLGRRPLEVTPAQRALAIACSVAVLPFLFVPFFVSLGQKGGERRRGARFAQEWRELCGDGVGAARVPTAEPSSSL